MVVAQLVERSLLNPEVRGSNPVVGEKLYWKFTVNCIEKTKIKKKRPGLSLFKKHWINETNKMCETEWRWTRRVTLNKMCDAEQDVWRWTRRVTLNKTCDAEQDVWRWTKRVTLNKNCDAGGLTQSRTWNAGWGTLLNIFQLPLLVCFIWK